MTAAKIRV